MKPSDRRSRRSRANPFRVVHEDAQLLVADKDPGILTVPLPGKRSRNLKELLDRYLTSQKREALPVHRIDRYTSGLVVFAKSRPTLAQAAAVFRAGGDLDLSPLGDAFVVWPLAGPEAPEDSLAQVAEEILSKPRKGKARPKARGGKS